MAGVEEATLPQDTLDKEVYQLKTKYKDKCKLFNGTEPWRHIVVLNNPDIGLRIKWRIPGSYPDNTPTVEITCANHKDTVQDYIKTQVASMKGQQYMIDKTWRRVMQWLKQTGFKLKGNEQTNTENVQADTKQHVKETTKEAKDQNGQKKSSMKTAEDVISRIMWDEDLEKKLFTIGYIDRFVGVMEKNFDAFTWGDLASVDDYYEFAIPQHRIQYFKYNGEIVWDKTTRLDNVFGSTGGVTISDIVVNNNVENEAKPEEGPNPTVNTSSASGVTASTNINSSQEQSSKVASVVDDKAQTSHEYTNLTQTEDNRSSDTDNSFISGSKASDIQSARWTDDTTNVWTEGANISDEESDDDCQDTSEAQGGEVLTKREQYWGKKVKPTHFLCVRITNPETVARIQETQHTIVDIEPRYASCAIPPCRLHTTIACLGLDDQEQIENAIKTLKNFRQEWLENRTQSDNINLSLKDTGVFTGATLYAKIENNTDYIDFVESLQTKLIEGDVEIRDIFDYTPHVTILKYARKLQKEHRTKYLDTRVCTMFQEVDFGTQIVDNLYLCEKGETKQEDGFYVSPCNIDFT